MTRRNIPAREGDREWFARWKAQTRAGCTRFLCLSGVPLCCDYPRTDDRGPPNDGKTLRAPFPRRIPQWRYGDVCSACSDGAPGRARAAVARAAGGTATRSGWAPAGRSGVLVTPVWLNVRDLGWKGG